MQQIDSTTFTANGLGDVKPNVTIGGKDKAKFIPNINMSYHDDEFFINLNRRDKIAITSAVDGKEEIGGIDKDIFHIDDQGRFKWDIEFSSRPAVNSWTWELKHTKGIEFYYQGELTPEEIADGCERPEEVVGSYAVYCSKVNNKYKTGKLCHIYRPFCYDAKGNTIYADLKIADGQLAITIDAKWLDSAVYPVRLDPTIGYTAAGGTWGNWTFILSFQNIKYITDGSSGVSDKMYAYLSSDFNKSIKLGYYNSSNSLVDSSDIASGWATGWNDTDVSGNIITSGESYSSAFCFENGTGGIAYDSISSASYLYYPPGFLLPTTWTSTTSRTELFSMYLSYTESGGSSIVPIILSMNHFNGGM